MATEVIHHHDTADSGNGVSLLIGAIILAAIVLFMFYFVTTMFRGMSSGQSVQIPDKVDVNLNQGGAK